MTPLLSMVGCDWLISASPVLSADKTLRFDVLRISLKNYLNVCLQIFFYPHPNLFTCALLQANFLENDGLNDFLVQVLDSGGMPELMPVLTTLAEAGSGAGHLDLLTAVTQWLVLCKQYLCQAEVRSHLRFRQHHCFSSRLAIFFLKQTFCFRC